MSMDVKELPVYERIKKLRKERGWTQFDLAKKVDIDNNMIGY
ncbi:MAG: helix-turn-helix transcriptional regulator [bacterium]|nr:helix-turn-helix transcriptional regulator [bacterium]